MTSIVGARTRNLEGLVVHADRGLGGRALVEKRPRLALDYRSSRSITHDYDRAVLGEGIATLFAVPSSSRGAARGVHLLRILGAVARRRCRRPARVRGRRRRSSTELRVRDEVERRVSPAPPATGEPGLDAGAREELRESYAELRSIAAVVDDADVRGGSRCSSSASPHSRTTALRRPVDRRAPLAPRDGRARVRARSAPRTPRSPSSSSLKEGTVKSYLQSAMAKLDASTRHAAVARARRARHPSLIAAAAVKCTLRNSAIVAHLGFGCRQCTDNRAVIRIPRDAQSGASA